MMQYETKTSSGVRTQVAEAMVSAYEDRVARIEQEATIIVLQMENDADGLRKHANDTLHAGDKDGYAFLVEQAQELDAKVRRIKAAGQGN